MGLFALLPAVVDAVDLPVIATGGIADGRTAAAAILMGAAAVQVGTGLLRTPEASTPSVWAEALAAAQPEDTAVTRAFSGRAGRSIRTAYVEAAFAADAPPPAPYPIQRGLTQAMRSAAVEAGELDGMQAWAGQASRLAPALPAGDYVTQLWEDTRALLGG